MTIQTQETTVASILSRMAMNQLASQMTKESRNRIGILGGTFNPPHLGHLLMAEQVGSQLELDEVWFMPTAQPPHRPGKSTIEAHHRLAMLELAIADNPLFKIQAYEINRGGKNFTADTMAHFRQEYPGVDFYFIIGADSVRDLPIWYDVDRLLTYTQLVGISRPGVDQAPSDYPILWVDSPAVDLSSTEIRLRVFLEQSIRYQVPQAVADYIATHGLYAMTDWEG